MEELRTYVAEQISKVDSELSAWDRDLFGNNDATTSLAENFYNLFFGDINTSRQDGDNYLDEFTMTLDIWSAAGINLIDEFDALYGKARQIRNNILIKRNLETLRPCVIDIDPISIVPSEEETNDNLLRMRLNFIVRQYYVVC